MNIKQILKSIGTYTGILTLSIYVPISATFISAQALRDKTNSAVVQDINNDGFNDIEVRFNGGREIYCGTPDGDSIIYKPASIVKRDLNGDSIDDKIITINQNSVVQ